MSVIPGREDKNDEADKILFEEASLFMWFVNAVNSDDYGGGRGDEASPLPPKKKLQQKIRFKTYSMNVDNFVYEKKDDIAFEEDRNGFICAHCDARYIYKRCLINHLVKSHHTGSNAFSRTF